MVSKIETEVIFPASRLVQFASQLEREVGTHHRLGFETSAGDAFFMWYVDNFSRWCNGWGPTIEAPDDNDLLLSHALVRWHAGGMPRFRLTHGLVTQLAMTDPNGIDLEQIQQPFPTYIIELPRPKGPLLWDTPEGLTEPKYMFVHRNMCGGAEEIVRGTKIPNSKILDELVASRRRATTPKQSVILFDGLRPDAQGYILAQHRLLDTHVLDLRDQGRLLCEVEVTGHDETCLVMAERISYNLALYLRHHPNRSSGGGRVVNHEHGLQSKIYEVGEDVPLIPELRDAARSACETESGRERWVLAQRFIVRGHWKEQPFGPGRTQRKLIFVQPYWKGPAGSPVVSRAYTDEKS